MSKQYKEILSRYFPPETIDQVFGMLEKHTVQLTISRYRSSKLGDYRPPHKQSRHRISINGGLSPLLTYLIYLHEYAHLLVWNKFGRKVSPHGKQWKEEFGSLLRQAIFLGHVPNHLQNSILAFSQNVKATFAADNKLWKQLQLLENGGEDQVTVEQLPVNSYFSAGNGRVFRKEEKLRTRFRCFCLTNNRRYLFHPSAIIHPLGEKPPGKIHQQ